MLIAQLHFEDGSETEQPIPDGQTVPFRLQHIQDGDGEMIVHTFAYRKGQPGTEHVIHYDELPNKIASARQQSA
jgi:hypothetical protein